MKTFLLIILSLLFSISIIGQQIDYLEINSSGPYYVGEEIEIRLLGRNNLSDADECYLTMSIPGYSTVNSAGDFDGNFDDVDFYDAGTLVNWCYNNNKITSSYVLIDGYEQHWNVGILGDRTVGIYARITPQQDGPLTVYGKISLNNGADRYPSGGCGGPDQQKWQVISETFTIEPAPLPDVDVWAMSTNPADPQVGEPVDLKVTLKNIGDATAYSPHIKYYIENSYIDDDYAENLSPNEEDDEQEDNYVFTSSGYYDYKVVVDPVADEENLANNTQIISIYVAPDNYPPNSPSFYTSGPSTLYPTKTYTITVDYTDPDGQGDLDNVYLRLAQSDNENSNRLTMMWGLGILDNVYQWNDETPALKNMDASKVSITNGYRVTWEFEMDWNWFEHSNVDYWAFSIDDAGIESSHTKYNRNAYYENDIRIYTSTENADPITEGDDYTVSGLISFEGTTTTPEDWSGISVEMRKTTTGGTLLDTDNSVSSGYSVTWDTDDGDDGDWDVYILPKNTNHPPPINSTYYDLEDITINSVNDPPVIAGLPDISKPEDCGEDTYLFDLDSYVSDVDNLNSELTFTHDAESWLNLTIDPSTHRVYCDPDLNQNGNDNIKITVSDPGGLNDDDIFELTIYPVNDPPIATRVDPNQSNFEFLQGTSPSFIAHGLDIDPNLEYARWYLDGTEIPGSYDDFYWLPLEPHDEKNSTLENYEFMEHGEHTLSCLMFDYGDDEQFSSDDEYGEVSWYLNIIRATQYANFSVYNGQTNSTNQAGVELNIYEEDWSIQLYQQVFPGGVQLSWSDALWGNLPFEVWYDAGNNRDEFWSGGNILIDGQTTTYDFTRQAPYELGIHLAYQTEEDANNGSPYLTINEPAQAGSSIFIPVQYTNFFSYGKPIKVRLYINEEGNYDNYVLEHSTTIAGNSSEQHMFEYYIPETVPHNTVYKLGVEVYSEIDGNYIISDSENGWVEFGVSNILPIVESTYPEEPNNTDIPVDAWLYVYFDMEMDEATVENSSNFIVKQGNNTVSGTIEYDNISYYATFTPDQELLPETEYTVTLTTNIESFSGKPLDGNSNGAAEGSPVDDYVFSFTTEAAPNNVTLELYQITDTDGIANTVNPGNELANFIPGSTVRITMRAINEGYQDIPVQCVLNIRGPDDATWVYDSNPGNNNSADSPLVPGEGYDYYSFDWQIPSNPDAGFYDIGASLRDQNDFNIIYETTCDGPDTDFNCSWILEDKFEIFEIVINIVTGPSGTINYNDVTFSWEGAVSNGFIAGYEYEIDGLGYSTGIEIITFNDQLPGPHNFRVRCFDGNGNYSLWDERDYYIDYIQASSKPPYPIIFIHGWNGDGTSFAKWIDEINENSFGWEEGGQIDVCLDAVNSNLMDTWEDDVELITQTIPNADYYRINFDVNDNGRIAPDNFYKIKDVSPEDNFIELKNNSGGNPEHIYSGDILVIDNEFMKVTSRVGSIINVNRPLFDSERAEHNGILFQGMRDISNISNQSSIVKTGRGLKKAIDLVKLVTNSDKVILVGHSMGGLTAREYVQSDYYEDDVALLTTYSTPHMGSNTSNVDWVAQFLGLEFDLRSDAVRDLRYRLEKGEKGPPASTDNAPYLFGANNIKEKDYDWDSDFKFYSFDVNANGDDQDYIVGLNKRDWPLDVPIFAVIGYGGNDPEDPACTDIIVRCDRQYPPSDFTGIPEILLETHSIFIGEITVPHMITHKQFPEVMIAIDEPDIDELAYELKPDISYTGFITDQMNGPVDDDWYFIQSPTTGYFNITFSIPDELNTWQVEIFNGTEAGSVGTAFDGIDENDGTNVIEFSGTVGSYYYVKVTGIANEDTYMNPYRIEITPSNNQEDLSIEILPNNWTVSAGDDLTVHGIVRDELNNPVPNLPIGVEDPVLMMSIQDAFTTNENGEFFYLIETTPITKEANYAFVFFPNPYNPSIVNISVTNNQSSYFSLENYEIDMGSVGGSLSNSENVFSKKTTNIFTPNLTFQERTNEMLNFVIDRQIDKLNYIVDISVNLGTNPLFWAGAVGTAACFVPSGVTQATCLPSMTLLFGTVSSTVLEETAYVIIEDLPIEQAEKDNLNDAVNNYMFASSLINIDLSGNIIENAFELGDVGYSTYTYHKNDQDEYEYITLSATDEDGVTQGINIWFDLDAPSTPEYNSNEYVWFNANPTLDIDFEDDIALGKIEYQIDSNDDSNPDNWNFLTSDGNTILSESQDCLGTEMTINWMITNSDWDNLLLNSQTQGWHYIYFKIEDDAGNIFITPTQEDAFKFGKDIYPPSVTFLYPEEDQILNTNDVEVFWDVSDVAVGLLLSGIDNIYYKIDGQSQFTEIGPNVSSHFFSNLSEGDHTVYLYANDNAGNQHDVVELHFTINTSSNPPDPFALSNPDDLDVLTDLTPLLEWESTIDPDGGDITYELWYDFDPSYATKIIESNLTNNQFAFPSSLIDNSRIYWKVKAIDELGEVRWCDQLNWSFYTNTQNDPPLAFNLNEPVNEDVVADFNPYFDWSNSIDIDPDDEITYYLWIGMDPAFSQGTYDEYQVTESEFSLANPLASNSTYYWKVKAEDNDGATTWSTETNWWFETPNNKPVFVWTGQPEYENDGLDPEIGETSTSYEFRIMYSDQDGDAPGAGYPKLHVLKSNVEIASSPFSMSEFDTEPYETGRIYTHTLSNLEAGSDYAYYFEAYDQFNGLASGDGTTLTAGPIVNGIKLNNPDGDETWYANQSYQIDWSYSGNFSTFNLEYSINNGADWNTIILDLPNNVISHNWIVPNTPSTECLVRVIGNYEGGSVADQSDAVFEIVEPINPPNPFSLISPVSIELPNLLPTFEWHATVDPDGTPITYELWYATLPSFSDKVIIPGLTVTSYTLVNPLPDNTTIYWKVKATDGDGQVTWSNEVDWYFYTNVSNDPPTAFSLVAPENETLETPTQPELSWGISIDPDPNDNITYTLFIGTDANFGSGTYTEYANIETNSYTLPVPLALQTYYYWKVKAVDNNNSETWCFADYWWFKTSDCLPLTAADISSDQTVCFNTVPDPLSIDTYPTGGDGNFSYQWQSSVNDIDFYDIQDANAELFTPLALTSNTYFRLIATSGICGSSISNSVVITVYPEFLPGTIGNDQEICYGETPDPIVLVNMPTGGDGTYSYQWQISLDDQVWNNIDGETATSLSPGQLTDLTYYRCEVSSGSNCGTETTNEISISISAQAIADAGTDGTVCEDGAYTLSGAATNYSSVEWSSSGDGTFDNEYILDATYTPGANEQISGNVTLLLSVSPIAPCTDEATDELQLSILNAPITDAGGDDNVCENGTYTLTGSATNNSGVSWSTPGDGNFDDPDILNATYTPGAADIDNGFVELTLTAFPVAPCTDYASDAITLTVDPLPVAVAASDNQICESASFTLSGVANHHSGIQWSTNGDGSFDDQGILNATYTPGASDIIDGYVELTLTAYPLAPCTEETTDNINLSIEPLPGANAGTDGEVCEDGVYTLSGTATNYSSVEWTSSGDGIFDNEYILDATYTHGAADLVNGNVTLQLSASPVAPCTDLVTDELQLSIIYTPTANAGNDNIVCENNSYALSGSATDHDGILWSTAGDGAFNDTEVLDATYTPGEGDIVNGFVELTLTAFSAAPCTGFASDVIILTVDPLPIADAGSDDNVCENSSYTLSGLADHYASIAWSSSGDGAFDNTNILNATYTPGTSDIANSSVDLTLTVLPIAPCTDEATDIITLSVDPLPLADAGLDGEVCEDGAYTLSGTATNYSSVEWTSSGDGVFDNEYILGANYTPGSGDLVNGNVTLQLTASPVAPCTGQATDELHLNIIYLPIAIAGSDDNVCENSSYTLSGSATDHDGISWSTAGDGAFNDTEVLDATYTPGSGDIANGFVELTLMAFPATPCTGTSSDIMLLTIDPLPIANAGTDEEICETGSYVLQGSALYYEYVEWSGGLGSFSNVNDLNAVYTPGINETGSVVLSLKAFGSGTCSGEQFEDQMTLMVTPAPSVDAGIDSEICETDSFILQGSATEYDYVEWSGGNGSFSNLNDLNAVYTPGSGEIGDIQFTLTVFGNGSCSYVTDDVLLTITPMPSAEAGSDIETCEMTAITVLNASADNYSSVEWTHDGLGNMSGAGSLTPTYMPAAGESGSITLTLTAYGNGSCTEVSDELSLTITAAPIANAGVDSETCEMTSYTVSDATAFNYSSVQWTHNGNGNLSGANTLTPTYMPATNETGQVILTLTVDGMGSCSDDDDSMILNITPNPTVDAGTNTEICEASEYILQGSATDYSYVEWSGGNGSYSNVNDLNAIYYPGDGEIGDVVLTLTAYSNGSCDQVSDGMTLSITPAPIVNAGSDAEICETGTYSMQGSATNYNYVEWSGGSGSFSNVNDLNAVYTPGNDETGNIELTLTAIGNGSCDPVSDEITLYVTPSPYAYAGPDDQICEGNNYEFANASASNYSSIQWTTDGLGILYNSSTLNPIYAPADGETGVITFELTVYGDGSCTEAYDEMTITIYGQPTAYAGPDEEICQDVTFTVTEANAEYYTLITWTHNGSGYLINENTLTPTYVPADLEAGEIMLSLIATGSPYCDDAFDEMVLTIYPMPDADAGEDAVICVEDSYVLSGSARDYNSIEWTTSGDGTFDNANILDATYTPGDNDIANGIVELTLTASPIPPCNEDVVDALYLEIIDMPITPDMPNGSEMVVVIDQAVEEIYTTSQVTDAMEYIWSIYPQEAGYFEGDNNITDINEVNVFWNVGFGDDYAYLKVMCSNDCGESIYSDSLEVFVDQIFMGADGQESYFDFIIQPNPTHGKINIVIHGMNGSENEIQIINNEGQVVYKSELIDVNPKEYVKDLDLSFYPRGVYHIRLISDEKYLIRKVVKQ